MEHIDIEHELAGHLSSQEKALVTSGETVNKVDYAALVGVNEIFPAGDKKANAHYGIGFWAIRPRKRPAFRLRAVKQSTV